MKDNAFSCQKLFNWRTPYSLATLILFDFLGTMIFIVFYFFNYESLLKNPEVVTGGFEKWLLILSLLHKQIFYLFMSVSFAVIKPILALLIFKSRHMINILTIVIYVIEIFASILFIISYRIPNFEISFEFFFDLLLELYCIIYMICIVWLAFRNLKK